jgi:hypothetical protein
MFLYSVKLPRAAVKREKAFARTLSGEVSSVISDKDVKAVLVVRTERWPLFAFDKVNIINVSGGDRIIGVVGADWRRSILGAALLGAGV